MDSGAHRNFGRVFPELIYQRRQQISQASVTSTSKTTHDRGVRLLRPGQARHGDVAVSHRFDLEHTVSLRKLIECSGQRSVSTLRAWKKPKLQAFLRLLLTHRWFQAA